MVGLQYRLAREGGVLVGANNMNSRPTAWFSRKNRGGARIRVVGTYMGWVNPRLRGCGCRISCRREEVVLVVLTCYLLIPTPFPTCLCSQTPLNLPISILSSSQMCWGLAACVRVALWLRNDQEKARLSQFDRVRTYADLILRTS